MTGWLAALAHDAVHTLDLPNGNRSSDVRVSQSADEADRILVTKDSDFVDSHLLTRCPKRLLLISTGNITNRELKNLLLQHLPGIEAEFTQSVFLEFGRTGYIVRG
jgi:predicted nuclease of predicted toxin-antitoxin system